MTAQSQESSLATDSKITEEQRLNAARLEAKRIIHDRWPFMYLAAYVHLTVRGNPLRFDNRPWAIDIYKDDADCMVIPKGSQIGISEFMRVRLFGYQKAGLSVMYIMPNENIRNRFVSNAIDPLINKVPEYKRATANADKAVHSKGLKTIYGRVCAFVGSNSPENFYEMPVDVLLFDEIDLCNQANLTYAYDRLGAAERRRWIKVGNPTVTGRGISDEYELSDKRQWHVQCPHCNERQPLDWFVNFVRQEDDGSWFLLEDSGGGDSLPLCRRCHKVIDRLADGEWVAEHPGRPVHGYHVSRLFAAPGNDHKGPPRCIVRETFDDWILAQGNPTKLQRFFNNILGVPFAASGTKITEGMIADCVADYGLPMDSVDGVNVAGCDTGGDLHLRIHNLCDGKERLVHAEVIRGGDYNTLALRCAQFHVDTGVIDAQGDLNMTRRFVEDHGEWLMCYYNKGADSVKEDVTVDYKTQSVRVNRTESIDDFFGAHARGRMEYPSNFRVFDGGELLRHMVAPTRIYKEATTVGTDGRYIWDEGSLPDHYFHAGNYAHIASKISGGIQLYVG